MRQQRRFSCLRVIGCLLVIVGLGAGSVILMTTPERRERTERTACRANLRQLSTAMLAYARENDDRLPARAVWSRAIEPPVAVEQVFRCPTAPRGASLTYGMNPAMSGIRLDEVPEEEHPHTVLLFDGRDGVVIQRHGAGANYSYLNGRVRWLADPPEGSRLQVVAEDP